MFAVDNSLPITRREKQPEFDEMCADCQVASRVVRQLGLRDTIGWGVFPDAPTRKLHASHSNSMVRVMVEGSGEPPNNPPALHPKNQAVALCVTYRSELTWLRVGRTPRPIVYMAHPIAGQFKRNVEGAGHWLRYLRGLDQRRLSELVGHVWMRPPIIHAPYLAAIVQDKFAHPAGREGIIADCRDTVTIFDELWWVGGEVSEGMAEEAKGATVVRDLTHLGRLPPGRTPR